VVRSREVSQARLTSMGVRVSAAPSRRTIPSPDYGWRLCRTPPNDCASPLSAAMRTLEEITYDAGRGALADQESLVAGIRQRTGTLLAAHALVASFLGGTVLRDRGLSALGWVALVALVLGLVAAAILLAPWRLGFAVDARKLYDDFYTQASTEAPAQTLGWLAAAGFGHQALHEENIPRVRRMSWLLGTLAALMVAQTLAWLTALVVH
jgi:hypothetical protein